MKFRNDESLFSNGEMKRMDDKLLRERTFNNNSRENCYLEGCQVHLIELEFIDLMFI